MSSPLYRLNATIDARTPGESAPAASLSHSTQPVPFAKQNKTKRVTRETRHGQTSPRLFASTKSLRAMRQTDRGARLGRKLPRPRVLSVVLPGLRLPFRGGGVFRGIAVRARIHRRLRELVSAIGVIGFT